MQCIIGDSKPTAKPEGLYGLLGGSRDFVGTATSAFKGATVALIIYHPSY